METWRLIFLAASAFFLFLAYTVLRGGLTYRGTRARQKGEAQDFLSRAVRAPAVVVGMEQETERFFNGYLNQNLRISYPIVRFRTAQGREVESRVEVGVERNPPAVGRQLEVCYDSAQPHRSRLSGPGIYPPRMTHRGFSGCLMVAFCGVYGGLAVFGILLALLAPD